MTKRNSIILLFISLFPLLPLSAQNAEIILPEITTYIPASVERKIVLTAEMLEAEHLETLAAVIERCGIQNLSYGPYGLDYKPSIRGFTDETVRVVIDGICVNNAQYGTFDFSSINMAAVERVEIVKGGFTEGVEDEETVGGVIYITTKKQENGKKLRGETSVKTFFNSKRPLDSVFQKIDFAGQLGEANFLNAGATVNYAGNRFFYKCSRVDGGELLEGVFGVPGKGSFLEQKNAQVIDGQGNINFSHYLGDGNSLSFGDLFYAGYKNTPGPVNSVTTGLQKDYNNNFSLSLWNPGLAEGLFNLKNTAAWLCNNRFYTENINADYEGNESRHFINTFKYSGTADFTSLAGGRLLQLVGVSADFTSLDSTNDGKHIQFSGVVKETTKLALGRLLGGCITTSIPLAVKFCANDNKANFAFVPKLGFGWEFTHIKYFADLYRMVQFPNMDDLFWEGSGFHGNPNLKPESGWGADIGFELQNINFGNNELHGGLTVFSDYYKDKIQWGSGTTQNLSSAFYLGVDFNLGADFAGGLITLDLNGEYLYNRLLDKSNKLTYGKRIMWTPDFVCSAVIGINLEYVRFNISTQYMGRRYTSNLNAYYLKPYVLLNLSAEAKEIAGHLTPYVKLDNALNWQYQSVEGYAMPGISLTLGARYIF